MPDAALEVTGLWFWYDDENDPALRSVDLAIPRGQFVALVGANGSGKTTLVKHCNGLLRPSRGQVRVAGVETTDRSVGELAQQVGYLFQHPEQQIFGTTIRQELAFPYSRALLIWSSEIAPSILRICPSGLRSFTEPPGSHTCLEHFNKCTNTPRRRSQNYQRWTEE